MELPRARAFKTASAGGIFQNVASTRSTNSDIGQLMLRHFSSVKAPKGRLDQHYQMEEVPVGRGSFGAVRKCKNLNTNAQRAVKSIPLEKLKKMEKFENE